MSAVRCLPVLALLGACAAHASGLSFGENGAKALAQGGAFAAQADDLSAIQHNPAGLSQLSGFHFLLDGQFLNHQVTFLRKDPGGATTAAQQISNTGGLFILPELAVGYGWELAGMPLTVAVGAYGPPTVGRYAYPRPSYARSGSRYVEDPRKYAPQRYGLISSDAVIAFPSLSASVAPTPWLSLGGSLQYVFSHFQFAQTVYSGLATPTRQADEDPFFDTVVAVDLRGNGGVAGVLGARVAPTRWLAFGLSVRPPVTVTATGDFRMQLGEAATTLNAEVVCEGETEVDGVVVCPNAAKFTLQLPLEIKLGAHVEPVEGLGLNAEVVFEGWSALQDLVLEPRNIQLRTGASEPTTLETVHVPKHWRNTVGVRVGASYAFDFGLSARLGGMFEEGASPAEYTNLDFTHFTRFWATAGVAYQVGPVELMGSFAWTPVATVEVTNSELRQATTDSTVEGGVIGNGTYSSGGWSGGVGIRGKFGGKGARRDDPAAPTYITAGL